MAITTNAICNSFKEDNLKGLHNFTVSTGDVFKLALYDSSATIGADTTSFTTSGEVGNTGQYTSGGGALVNALVSVNGTTAFVDFNDLSFTGVTLTARGALIYNTSETNKAVAVLDFGSDKTATAGTFTVQFPNANDTQAIIRIS
jgi:hypothetical protein|tara:strand:+ start:122 stop:556 length:435 start_codon:yes stop_codon:yes gene_type:complete